MTQLIRSKSDAQHVDSVESSHKTDASIAAEKNLLFVTLIHPVAITDSQKLMIWGFWEVHDGLQ